MPKISNKHYDVALKNKVIEKLKEGKKPKEVAAFFGLSIWTIYRWGLLAKKMGILGKNQTPET